jgi:hypothetical protein
VVIPYRVVQRVAPQIGVALGHRTHEYNPYWDSPEVCVESRRTWGRSGECQGGGTLVVPRHRARHVRRLAVAHKGGGFRLSRQLSNSAKRAGLELPGLSQLNPANGYGQSVHRPLNDKSGVD